MKIPGIRKIVPRAIALLLCLLLGKPVEAEEGDAVIPQRQTGEVLLLVEKGEPRAEIVVANPSPVAAFAAAELRSFIAKATGAELPVVTQRTGGKAAIILGDGPETKAAGIDVSSLPRDGFQVKRVGDALFIAGRDSATVDPRKALESSVWGQLYERATLFGVYDFLERFVGVRFYFPGEMGTIVPHAASLAVPAVDMTEAPAFLRRSVSCYSGKWYEDPAGEMVGKNSSMYRLRAQTEYIPNCHGLSRLGLPERYAKEHPEYFALLSNGVRDSDMSLFGHHGHLCYSDEGLRDAIHDDAAAFLTGKTAESRGVQTRYGVCWDPSAFQPGYFNIMPQDGLSPINYCHCPACWRYYGEGRAGDLLWDFVGSIATRLKDEGVPGYITSMAYWPYQAVPEAPLPDNLLVMLACTGPWLEGGDADSRQRLDALVAAWNAKLAPHRVWMWNYASKYGPLDIAGVPVNTPRSVGAFYRHYAPAIDGAFMQSGADEYLFSYLNVYVFFKVAWDSSTDVEQLLQEHHESMFGLGAAPMAKFYDRLEDLWLNRVAGKIVETAEGPLAQPPSELELWENVYTQEELNRLASHFDEATRLAAGQVECLARIAFMRKHLLGALEKARAGYVKGKREVEDLVAASGEVSDGAAIVVDGALDEPGWIDAPTVTLAPFHADKALVKTQVRSLWDGGNLYLGIECDEPKIDQLSETRGSGDELIWQDSTVELFLDPTCARAGFYQIIVNSNGCLSSLSAFPDASGRRQSDWTWKGGVTAAARKGSDKWTAEIAVPFASLGIATPAEGTRIVANFCRSRNLRDVSREENQLYSWSPFLKQGFHDPLHFGSILLVKKKALMPTP
jgi:hypothetical protein